MAGMGKTGTVNITPEMMDEAIKAIQAYRTTAFGAADGIFYGSSLCGGRGIRDDHEYGCPAFGQQGLCGFPELYR